MLTKRTDWRDQLAELRKFMETWLGVRTPTIEQVTPETSFPGLPRALATFFALLRDHDLAAVFGQNWFVEPAKLEVAERPFRFYVENQGVYEWATDASSDDPPVFGRFNEKGDEWQLEGERLSAFLCQACLYEAACQTAHGAACAYCDGRDVEVILQQWTRFPFAAWRWPAYPTDFYFAPRAIAMVCPNMGPNDTCDDMAFSFFCAALDAASLAFMKPHITDSWEFCSL